MNAANSWKSYRQVATQTAPPGQLVLMLFDGALHSLERALTGFDYNDPREKNQTIHNNLQRAVNIIRQLNNSLNLEAGGKLAETLRSLYHYFDQRIVQSNLRKQRDGVDEVIVHLKELRDAWAEMLASQGLESQLQPALDGELHSDARMA
ncbi:MAG TPA: flagellar export chaperone FliS [Verrucomicrobiae bacterium]|jgi:flagellar protein FliS